MTSYPKDQRDNPKEQLTFLADDCSPWSCSVSVPTRGCPRDEAKCPPLRSTTSGVDETDCAENNRQEFNFSMNTKYKSRLLASISVKTSETVQKVVVAPNSQFNNDFDEKYNDYGVKYNGKTNKINYEYG
jgi:hypothetical protein